MAKVRVMARAIDMLGRQQIAGIPTAIQELFKNAHDAYADEVKVDYYRSDALFVLRDDGIGMTEQEFHQRWLTVGTDSKLEGGTLQLPVPDEVDRPRPVLGEKGIGRLAIATIGPQVLVLTRSRRQKTGNGITAALVNWGVFQLPGIGIEDIDIPVVSLGPGESAGSELVELLREQAASEVERLRGRAADTRIDRIAADLRGFDVDLPSIYEDIGWKRLDREGDQGTHFFIYPADRIIELDMREPSRDQASSLLKGLVGFSNTMIPEAEKPPLVASFRDHQLDGTVDEVISPGSFWTPDEIKAADHRVTGKFDEDGVFHGLVRVYGGDPVAYVCSRPDPSSRRPECGPFALDFAYLQGNASESPLERSEFTRLNEKLARIGGLYIYRDGIRVLPYGDNDVDFLDIEKRRSKGAGYYFFSYRRMFGAVQVTRAQNSALVEKAGREGFQQNRAYRDFKQLLENLLVQLGATFFRVGGPQADVWERTKKEFDRLETIRAKREKESRSRRAAFAVALDEFFDRMNRDEPATEIARLEREANDRLRILAELPDKSRAAEQILTLRREALADAERILRRNRVVKPAGLGLTKSLSRDWSAYRKQSDQFHSMLVSPVIARLEAAVSDVVKLQDIPLDPVRRLVDQVQEVSARTQREVGARTRPLSEKARAAQEVIVRKARAAVAKMSVTAQEVIAAAIAERDLKEDGIEEVELRLSARLTDVYESQLEMLDRLDRALNGLLSEQEGITQEDLTEALEEQNQALREELDLYVELAQVGMAIGVVQHDFIAAIRTIRQSIRALQPWAVANPNLRKIERSLRETFEHLDGYLNLLTPMNRRLRRTRTVILGENVYTFLDSVLGERLTAEKVRLVATDEFRRYRLSGFPSTFLPVFVNLVDNARHWAQESEASDKRITLAADGRDLLIQDTGPGIPDREHEVIFDYGFTRKQGGRGLGLFITRQVLEREKWQISIDRNLPGQGASFRLHPPAENDDGAEPDIDLEHET